MKNKEYILSLALLISLLPGCVGSVKRPEKAIAPGPQEEVRTVADADIEDVDEDKQLLSWYEDVQEFAEVDSDDYILELADADDSSDTNDEDQTFAWKSETDEKEFDTLYFSFNSNKISEDQEDALAYNIQELLDVFAQAEESGDQPMVVVSGHSCNSAGSDEYNAMLSEQRAKSIAEKIISAGIDENRVKVVAQGTSAPVVIDGEKVDGDRENQWLNRRTEVSVIYT